MIEKVPGWCLNSKKPTGFTVPEQWNLIILKTPWMKYTFLKGIDFEHQITIYTTSEEKAWDLLRAKLKHKESDIS